MTLLEIAGHDVRFALDGEAADRHRERFRPDVMILDLGMPTVSGYDVARRILDRPWGRQVLYACALGLGTGG
jgi:DNA-binding response OmpR family regulator